MLIERQHEGMGGQLSGVYAPNSQTLSPSTLTYDAAGDVTNDAHTSNTYVYDAEGRVCAFETPNGLGGTTMVGYLYDGDGIRVANWVRFEKTSAGARAGWFLALIFGMYYGALVYAIVVWKQRGIRAVDERPAANPA